MKRILLKWLAMIVLVVLFSVGVSLAAMQVVAWPLSMVISLPVSCGFAYVVGVFTAYWTFEDF